jgi:hypothetical protein
MSLHVHWLWLQRTNSSRPWQSLHLQQSCEVRASASLLPPSSTSYCQDQGLHNHAWVCDIQGALRATRMLQYIKLWCALHDFTLGMQPNLIHWHWITHGDCSTESCCLTQFHDEPKPCAPGRWTRCTFTPWLACQVVLWTGLHPCVLCEEESEIMRHLLDNCSFSSHTWHAVVYWVYSSAPPQQMRVHFQTWMDSAIQLTARAWDLHAFSLANMEARKWRHLQWRSTKCPTSPARHPGQGVHMVWCRG